MMRTQKIERRRRMRGVGTTVTLEFMAGITVGIMVIKELLIVMIIHVVERCMLIIMVTGIAMTTGVIMVIGQAGAIHITIGVTMVTPRTVQLRDTINEGGDHPPVEINTILIGTGQTGKIRRERYLKVIEDGLGQWEGRKRDVTIPVLTAAVLQDIIVTVNKHLK